MSLFSVSRLDARVKLWLRSMDQVLLRQRGGAKARMGKLRLSLLKKTVLRVRDKSVSQSSAEINISANWLISN